MKFRLRFDRQNRVPRRLPPARRRAAEAAVLSNLAVIDLRMSRYAEAVTRLGQVLALCRESGDKTGQARALGNLGIVDYQQGPRSAWRASSATVRAGTGP